MYITPDNLVKQVAQTAFPDYNGRKFKVEIAKTPLNMASYWSGGSRDYWAVVKLDEMKVVSVPQQSAFDRPIDGIERVNLPAGFVAVKHTIFCGKDLGLTRTSILGTLKPYNGRVMCWTRRNKRSLSG